MVKMKLKEPMLAASGNTDVTKLRDWPYIVSPKIDGYRGLIPEGVLMSRKFIAIPNKFVSARFSRPEFSGLDGELILGPPAGENVMDRTGRACGNRSGEPDVKLYVFDSFLYPQEPYLKRLEIASEIVDKHPEHLRLVLQHKVHNLEELREFEEAAVKLGFEGVIGRKPNSPYKFGRSGGDGYMWKVKREATDEALIKKVNQGESNLNPAMRDNLGKTKRSTHKANKVLRDTAGSYECEMLTGPFKGVIFNCGLNADSEEAERIWKNRHKIEGKSIITVRYYPYGAKDKPKSARAVAYREPWDIPEEALV